jgi:organic hydroperoxide reductase OsmC/OhrA
MTTTTDLYFTTAVCSSRTGSVRVDDADATAVRVASPPGQDGWTAEQLYAAALATSLHEAIRNVVARGEDVADCTVAATVSLHHDGADALGLEARLKARLPGVPDSGRKREIVELAAARAPLVGGWDIVIA